MKPDDILTIPGAKLMVSIDEETEEGHFSSSLYYELVDLEKVEAEDIEKLRKVTVENYVAFIKDARSKPPYIPTKEDLLQQQDDEQKRLDEMITRLTSSTASKAELQAVADKLKSTYDTLIASASVSVKG